MGDANENLILNIIYNLQGSGKLKDAKVDLQGLEKGAQAATAEAKRMGDGMAQSAQRVSRSVDETSERLSINRRDWMRTGSEATFYLTAVTGKTGELGKGLAEATSTATQLGESFLWGGTVGVAIAGIGTVISYLVAEMQKATEEAKRLHAELIAPFMAGRAQIESMAGLNDPLKSIERSIPASRKQIDEYTQSSEAAAHQMLALVDAQNTGAQLADRLTKAQQELTAAETAQANALKDPVLSKTVGTMSAIADRVNRAKKEISDLAWAINANNNSQAFWNDLIHQGILELPELEDRLRRVAQANQVATLADDYGTRASFNKRLADQAELQTILNLAAAYDKLAASVVATYRTMVEKAITPTTVTQEDTEATAAGKYKDKWDELARQSDIIKRDGDARLAEFPRLRVALEQTGLTAEEFGKRFRDASLFADPKNLNLADWGAAEADVEKQLDVMLGKFNLTSEAAKRIWEKLPIEKKDALTKMGIMNADDAVRKAMGLDQDISVNAKEAPGFEKALAEMRKIIEETLGGDVTISVNYVGGGSSTGEGGATVPSGELSSTNTSGRRWGGLQEFAEGGLGTVTRSGPVWVDRGEQAWFSGTEGQVPPPGEQTINIPVYLDGALIARSTARYIRGQRG